MSAILDQQFIRRAVVAVSIGMLCVASMGCQSTQSISDGQASTGHTGWKQFGQLNSSKSRLHQQWDDWGSQQLKSGDVIFILGNSRVFMGLLNFSTFSTEIAASPFSHVGIISIEDGQPYVYDTVSGGPRRKELGWYVSRNTIQCVAFRRPRPEHTHHIPQVIEFCQQVYKDRVPYDEGLVWGNDKYYCSEFVDMAFREQDIPLCDLTAINELPNFDALPAALAMLIESTTPISPEQEVLFPGNDSYGIWSSQELTQLLPPQSPTEVPRIAAASVTLSSGDSFD
jgi:hypothetical protein